FPAPNQVKVVVRRDPTSDGSMVTHVAQVLGLTSLEVKATATAEVVPANEVCERMVPMGAIPPPGAQNFQVGCANQYTLVSGQGGGAQGNWLTPDSPACSEGACAGSPETGANTLNCRVTNGYSCCLDVGQVIQSEPGGNVGQMRSALQARFDNDTDRR